MDSPSIQSAQNARLKLVRAIRRGREREFVLLEGARVIDEALDAGVPARFLLCSPELSAVGTSVVERAQAMGLDVVQCDAELLAEGSDLDAASDVIAVVVRPENSLADCLLQTRRNAGLLLVAAGVQDPGNLGALVRVAAGLGAQAVVTLTGSASLWHPRAVRGSSGTHFRLPLVEKVATDEFVRECSVAGLPIWAADGAGDPYRETKLPGVGCALLLGEEGRGLPQELLSASARQIAIPLARNVESLNVATAAAVLCAGLVELGASA